MTVKKENIIYNYWYVKNLFQFSKGNHSFNYVIYMSNHLNRIKNLFRNVISLVYIKYNLILYKDLCGFMTE